MENRILFIFCFGLKNNLLDIAKQQIINLETKLKSLIERFNSKKSENEDKNMSSRIQSDKNEVSAIKWNSCASSNSYDEKKINSPNSLINLLNEILTTKQDSKLNNFLQVNILNGEGGGRRIL